MTIRFPDRNLARQSPALPAARDRVRSIEEIAALAQNYRSQGSTVVLAHGVFDLVHLGHVRHLEAAAREGDILIVTVTADEHVNKGPGRPVFSQQLRAEMVAAMECVSWAGVSRWPTAEEVISRIRPDVYVKGPDYRNEAEDITGKIRSEREAVERYGGRVVYTDDITFSSSNLINQHFSTFDPAVQGYLDDVRANDGLARAQAAIDGIKDLKVLMIGDAIIDEYQYAVPMGKSAKENIIATRSDGHELFAGGIIAAANHVADFCSRVDVVTMLGRQESHEQLIRESLHSNVVPTFLYRDGAPTTRKCRFVDPGHMRKLFEVYHFNDTPIAGSLEKTLCDTIGDVAAGYDVVVVADFGHGMMTRRAINTVIDKAPYLAVNAQSNSANHGFNLITKYHAADYICIDAPEARLATSDRFTDIEELITDHLVRDIDCDRVTITHGQAGCVVYEPVEGVHRVPAFTRQVVDTVGAGDAFLAVTSPLSAIGTDAPTVGLIGNAVGALKVGIVGHRQSVEKVPLLKYLTAILK
jgi:rfaE bifunctional protein nucleotidyltransferase chain/domain